MDEGDWLSGKHPYDLIYHKSCRSVRKRRLLVCACVAEVLPHLPEPIFRQAVELAERLADGLVTDAERKNMYREVGKAIKSIQLQGSLRSESQQCVESAVRALLEREFMTFKMAIESAGHASGAATRPNWERGNSRETKKQVDLARDIFANPFRSIAVSSGWLKWREGTVPKIAQTIYEEKRFADLPILADALEDAGCDCPDLLDHCREIGRHVRGCWALDLLLGKD